MYRIACLFVHRVFGAHASSACTYGCCRVVGMSLHPSWQGHVSGKITPAFNLHLQLGESTWRCQRFDFIINPTTFPKRTFGKKQPVNRAFQRSWFKTWSWLHYDEATDASFCYYCGKADQRGKLKATNWKHNLRCILKYKSS